MSYIRCDAIEKMKTSLCSPFITIIGRSGAGIPVNRIEAIVEFDNEAAKNIFRNGLTSGKVVKTLLDESKIKSLVILDSGEIHPSTFHYYTLKKRCSPYITLITNVGCDAGGINIDKVNLIVNYKIDNSQSVINELLSQYNIYYIYEDMFRTKCLLVMDSHTVYPCTFNFSTIRRRIHQIRGDENVPETEEDDDEE